MKRTLPLIFAVLLLFCCVLSFTAGAADRTDPADVCITHPADGTGFSMVDSRPLSKYVDGNIRMDTVEKQMVLNDAVTEKGVDNPDGINTNKATTWIIIVSAFVFCAIITVVIILAVKNRKKD